VGITSGLYFKPDIIFLAGAGFIIISGFLFSLFFNKYQTNNIFGYILTFSLFISGLLLYTNEKSCISVLKPVNTLLKCTLSDYPEEKDYSYLLKVKLNCRSDGDNTYPLKGSIILYIKKDQLSPGMIPGDILFVRCTPLEITNRGNPFEFNYRFFMENQGIKYYAYLTGNDIVRHISSTHRKLTHRALIVRDKIISMYRVSGIKGERLALVAAITLGQKNMLEPDQKLNFIKAGVMHIMAVSGLHAIILSLFVFNLLFFMKGRFNILRVIITIIILWSFAFVTGLTPSVLRATIMYSFLQAGKLMKRPANGINSVLASAFFLILVRPSVIFDAGFLLSYSAVIFIISFYQDFYLTVHFKNWFTDKIWQSAVVTIVAQAGTLPLTILFFNRFPTYFILANITIVPISNLLIITGCLVPLFFKVQFLSHFLALLLNYLTGLTETLTSRAASLPYSTIENIGSTASGSILLSVTIFLFCHWLFQRKTFPVFYPILALLLFVAAGTIRDISTKKSNEIIVYNTPHMSTIGLRTGKILNLYSDTTIVAAEVKRHCATLGLQIKPTVVHNSYHCLKVCGKNIIISKVLNKKIIQNFVPDVVILVGSNPEIENDLDLGPHPSLIIVTSEVSPGFHIPQQMVLSDNNSIYLVKKSGAFVKRI
jgi:competence protein ComEC